MPLANLANVLGGGNDESSGVTPGSFSSVTSSGGSFIGANGQTIVGDATGGWTVTANGTNQPIILTTPGSGATRVTNTTSSTTPITGAFRVGDDVSATTVGIGSGNISLGGNLSLATEGAAINFVNSGSNGKIVSNGGILTISTTSATAGNPSIVLSVATGRLINAGFNGAGAFKVIFTDSSSSSITGSLIIGNGTAATTVGLGGGNVWLGGILGVPGAAVPVLTTTTTITSGAAAQVGTLTNSPTAGNPTKWVPINDAGTTRYFPCW